MPAGTVQLQDLHDHLADRNVDQLAAIYVQGVSATEITMDEVMYMTSTSTSLVMHVYAELISPTTYAAIKNLLTGLAESDTTYSEAAAELLAKL